ncbi:hypothetical protein P152DRAFT_438711 [Eremomyces bilateralis CBS 781.70]|uniref:Aminopeptidase n=1 Tax=Eremomyces bilateralis CBS 781.70 TaxID=1392243 RepID=A0A6G1FZ95_9PEZI|nr:uncharacterized protein P152DRAFT_438711 [Eremomyces bilateralis CBS 781.70]KAF1811011.1 hypothetical protein P152DRAFT_438711 [Eremomyces bilateralis CBS 781.70]
MAQDRDILPDTVKPVNYELSIYDLELGGAFSYAGTVKIALDIVKSAKEIVLNTHQLEIQTAELFTDSAKTESSTKADKIDYDEKQQRATLSFADAFPATTKASLIIKFKGTMNNTMAGFYRSRYLPAAPHVPSVPKDGDHVYMFSTQFESSDARRAFPCFDEPNLKATFDFDIEIPDDQVALSNMPVKSEEPSKSGLKVVTFEKTPIMSTYLYAWAFGDLEFIEEHTARLYNGKSLPVRVYTTKGLKDQAQWALVNASKITDYFSEIFRVDYPLPKVDLLAVHEFSHGAMENWGLITYRTTAVLFDEKSSDQKYKVRVAYVVAHELAHQWFGNLVTMDWWNELWLNEGFATWVGWLATDHFNPSWNVWGQFVSESLQTAFALDSLRSSHPIEVPVRDALEVDQIFDHISYLKGSSIIRMLSAHLTQEKFILGVSNYLKAHQFGNAKTNDLWAALSEASGQDVKAFMDAWILKIGFPVLSVSEEPGQIGVKQSRFLLSGDVKPEEDESIWWVPLGLKTGSGSAATTNIPLTGREQTLRDIDETFYKLNADATGFYRTNYTPERLMKLGQARAQLSLEDKISLIADAAALAQAGTGTTAGFLALVENFKDEDNYLVWSRILTSLGNVRTVFADIPDISEGLRKFTLKLVSQAAEKVGWDCLPNDELLTLQLRALLISSAGRAGHEGIIAGAQQRFKAHIDGIQPLHPNLRLPVFRVAIKNGGATEYQSLQHEYKTTTSIDGKEICLQSMGLVQSPALAADFLAFLFSDAVAVQDVHSGSASLGANPATRTALWEFIKANWETKVYPRLSGNMVVLDRFLKVGLDDFASAAVEEDIRRFFEGKDNKGYDRTLSVLSDTIKGNATYQERDQAVVKEWLSAHGYM